MLNQNAPQKKKHVRGNQVTFMTKHKELIERSRNRKEDDRTLYNGKEFTIFLFCKNLRETTMKT